jgi:hypothetical protein
MAKGIMQLLQAHGAVLFAAAIPHSLPRPAAPRAQEYLRKDHVFLFERFFYLLEEKQRYGLLVMDEVDKTEDRRFVRRMERYFTKTAPGQYRTSWVVPDFSSTAKATATGTFSRASESFTCPIPMAAIERAKKEAMPSKPPESRS